jgi:hypothetical protein
MSNISLSLSLSLLQCARKYGTPRGVYGAEGAASVEGAQEVGLSAHE